MDYSTKPSRHSNMSPVSRQISPVKQKTPSRRVSIKSPHKSPASARKAFQCEAVSFTPKRTQQPPRAWERRPATPFIPRDEKQKIWKRVPLGELGVDGNRPSGLSRRVQEGTKDYVRVVKKLKVDREDSVDGNDEDKENLIVAIGSKLVQDDDYCDHPKKRRIVSTNNLPDVEAIGDETGSAHDTELTTALIDFIGKTTGVAGEDERVESTSDVEAEEHMVNASHESDVHPFSPRTDVQSGHQTSIEVDEQLPQRMESGAEMEHHASAETEENDAADKTEIRGELSLQNDEDDIETPDEGTAHDQRSSSPPTILADNITVDELAAKQSAEADLNEQTAISATHDASHRQDGSRRTSDGEAAFLRAFMDRAMNEKTAREKSLELSSESGKIEIQQDLPKEIERYSETVAQEVDDQPEPTSPLRRSKRALVTNIPRLQSAPNAIQLKRANGNEFIFTANKATSAMNIGATTRANTKKNKGSALNVPTRLEQLTTQKAEEAAEYEESTKVEPLAKIGKKRRQEKGEDASKAKKVLRWNNENLVAFREADPNMDGELDEIEDSSQEHAPVTRKAEDPSQTVKLKLTVNFSAAQKAENETSRPSGLRRVRRGVVGNVNGTPAPKARVRKFEEMSTTQDEEDDDADAEATKAAPAATSSKIPSSSRRSRMPVPTSSQKTEVALKRAKNTSTAVTMQEKSEQHLGRRSLRIRQ